ncbi:MAG: single-stranded-DNA-specific exonuclease RecJ [Cellvibrionaceae bacterium]|nr:single-stranded-DNA-specific exonuclease RecJ [Cellvibrionaceae bacterium]
MKKTIRRRSYTASLAENFTGLSPLLERIYLARGVVGPGELDYSLGGLIKPDLLKGVPAAVELLIEALQQQKKICIVGDFDADGATSTSVCYLCLQAMGFAAVDYIVPNRFEYGYGLSPEIVEVVARDNAELLITVDNGISSIDGVAAAKQLGMQVLVTDHHLAGAELPAADAIVNPNQPGCDFPSKSLAGVGVIFYLMNALRAELRRLDWFTRHQLSEPNMAQFLDLVALGTVADVVPLDANNRILVYQGIKRMRAGHCRPGIRALLEIGGRNLQRLTTSDLGFAAGPRLNAAGRLDDMSLGIRCLLSETAQQATSLAGELDDLNRERKAIEQSMRAEAFKYLGSISLQQRELPSAISLYQKDWHQGVIGILASRIKDKLNRPTIIFAQGDPGYLKGSGRSIPGVHLRDALDEVATLHPGLLSKFGGHAMAAGLSLDEQHLVQFQEAFDAVVAKQLQNRAPEALILSDGALQPHEFSLATAFEIRNGGPWGQHFPEPVFDGVFRIVQQRIVGSAHLKLVLAAADDNHQLFDAIVFHCDLELWPNTAADLVCVAYKLDLNEYQGKQSLQLLVDYIEPFEGAMPAAAPRLSESPITDEC